MSKFTGAVILLFITVGIIIFNSAYIKDLSDEMRYIAYKAKESAKSEDYDTALGYITELSDYYEDRTVYFGIICNEDTATRFKDDINEAKALLNSKEYGNLPVVLASVFQSIAQLGKYEIVSIETLF